jgi:hypothetical protein
MAGGGLVFFPALRKPYIFMGIGPVSDCKDKKMLSTLTLEIFSDYI